MNLRERTFEHMTSNHLEFAPLAPMIAGTAVNMARSAKTAFKQVDVLCRIGDDEFTPTILAYFKELSVEVTASITRGMRNGTVLIVRDVSTRQPGGTRLLISGTPTPHARLSAQDVRDASALIRDSDIAFADSYGLLEADSRSAIEEAQAIAGRFDIPFCLDLVPHDIDRRVDKSLISRVLRSSDIVAVSAPTLARLLGLPERSNSSDTMQSMAESACQAFGRRITWLVSFGAGDMGAMARLRSGALEFWYETGYAESGGPLNYGDRLVAIELHRLVAASRGMS